MNKPQLILGLMILGGLLINATAADLAVKTSDQSPPQAVGDSIRAVLESKSIEVQEGGKPVYQFWFRKELPLQSAPESVSKDLDSIAETTLLGMANVGEGRRDFKDNEIAPGTYTIRFGLQPQDGDHLGTSEFPYFAVLIPIKSDPQLESITKYKAMVKASGKGTATGHPIVLAMRPLSAAAPDAARLTSPAPGLQAFDLKLQGKDPNSSQSIPLSFELVVQGKYKS